MKMKYSLKFIDWVNAKAHSAMDSYKGYLFRMHLDELTNTNNLLDHEHDKFNEHVEVAKHLADEDYENEVYLHHLYVEMGEDLLEFWNGNFNNKFNLEINEQSKFEEIVLLSKELNDDDKKEWMNYYSQFIGRISLTELLILKEVYPEYSEWENKYDLENVWEGDKVVPVDHELERKLEEDDISIEYDSHEEEEFKEDDLDIVGPQNNSSNNKDYSKLKISELKELLDARGISYKKSDKKSDLIAKLG